MKMDDHNQASDNTYISDPQIFNMLIEFLEEDNWGFEWGAGESTFMLRYEGESAIWDCIAHPIDILEQFTFYSLYPLPILPEHHAQVIEYVMRVNNVLTYGNFEFDYETSVVRFRTGIDVEGAEINHALMRQVIYGNIVTFDHYMVGIERVVRGEKPADVVKTLHDALDDFDDEADPTDE
jgi:hypothetical protein